MKLAYYIKSASLREDARVASLLERLASGGHSLHSVHNAAELEAGTDMLLSIGGDGTFLSAADIAVRSRIPVLGVNMGRLGFLSEYTPEEVVAALAAGEFNMENRRMLEVECDRLAAGPTLALNEVSVSRLGAAMLGVDVTIDGKPLPTYWADGLLVATSSGSTAYSLSVGGPICTPDARVVIIAPIAPHNLNVRPLVVPDSAVVELSLRSRDSEVRMTVDNRTFTVPAESRISVRPAEFCLSRVSLGRSSFMDALSGRLLWGQDVRNHNER